MKRFLLKLKFALPVAILLTSTALVTTPARAEWEQMGKNEDGSATLYYNEATGLYAVIIEKNGKYSVHLDGAVVKAMIEKMGWGHQQSQPGRSHRRQGHQQAGRERAEKAAQGRGRGRAQSADRFQTRRHHRAGRRRQGTEVESRAR